MADGWWEVDVPKKANSFCGRCTNTIGTSELRFQWCPVAGGEKPYLHVLCAVKAGAKQYAAVSKASVRKSTGLTGVQRGTLTSLLTAPSSAAAAALLQAAGGAQAPPPAAAAKRPAPASSAGGPPATKRARAAGGQPATPRSTAGPMAEVKAKAKAKGKAKAKAKVNVKAKPGPKARAKPPAKASATPRVAARKGNVAISAKDLARFEEQSQAFGAWSNEKLKALLKANDQSRSGNKAVLIAKCADGAAFGRLPRCPKCFGGKIKFRMPAPDGSLLSLFTLLGGGYGQDKEDDRGEEKLKERRRFYCTGFFDDDEKQECDWQADTVKREAWVSA